MSKREQILALRGEGLSLRAIAKRLETSVGMVTYHLYQRVRPIATKAITVKHMPVLGSCGSRSCYTQAVSLPRISVLDRPFVEAAHAA
ncbi:helix-turn-helix domain-containing protein [Mesorhizobium sp. DCY119]|uniref:helix-turn-helix domain-containing protein n=1 Tax=Mesorhizobium sp. DCY119 TaxID=2108445 RepID=UPI0013C4A1D5|nr:helix-turn-helix domain-containing protein [Mesorhizobium sp. DCY119]